MAQKFVKKSQIQNRKSKTTIDFIALEKAAKYCI